MKDQKQIDDFFGDFFREEGTATLFNRQDNGRGDSGKDGSFKSRRSLPEYINEEAAEDSDRRAFWQKLRAFFRESGDSDLPGSRDSRLMPASLASLSRAAALPTDYPFCFFHLKEKNGKGGMIGHFTLWELLDELLENVAEQKEALAVFQKHRHRFEHIIHKFLKEAGGRMDAAELLKKALKEYKRQLNLAEGNREEFEKFLDELTKASPSNAIAYAFSRAFVFHLLASALRAFRDEKTSRLLPELKRLKSGLADLVEIEQLNRGEEKGSGGLADSLGFADNYINFEEWSSVMPATGSEPMPDDRFERIKMLHRQLDKKGELLSEKTGTILLSDRGLLNDAELKEIFLGLELKTGKKATSCSGAVELWDRQAAEMAQLVAAMRMARLELKSAYSPEIHDEYFKRFDWHSFTEEELELIPPVVLIADSDRLLSEELDGLSSLLASGKPLRLLALKQDDIDTATDDQSKNELELGGFAMAHRNAFVLQCNPVSPAYLAEGLMKGLSAPDVALIHLQLPAGDSMEDLLRSSAAVEGRYFPGFTYDPFRGMSWGSRFDLQANPEPASDWPLHQLKYIDSGGEKWLELPLTYADYFASREGGMQRFMQVPGKYDSDELMMLDEYLRLGAKEMYGKVPFIWMIDEEMNLHKAAVSWALVRQCLTRLDYWHYLQENSGIHNFHADLASEQARKELQGEFERKMEELETRHQRELEAARKEAAGASMERLASMLLELDLEPEPVRVRHEGKQAEAERKSEDFGKEHLNQEASAEKEEVEELPVSGEAYIDTPLCTSCNECTNLNNRIFKYNSAKQAYVADPAGGPFADIVEAAELCPAAIIHPGKPQYPDEEGLDELIKRAEPFN